MNKNMIKLNPCKNKDSKASYVCANRCRVKRPAVSLYQGMCCMPCLMTPYFADSYPAEHFHDNAVFACESLEVHQCCLACSTTLFYWAGGFLFVLPYVACDLADGQTFADFAWACLYTMCGCPLTCGIAVLAHELAARERADLEATLEEFELIPS